MKHLKKGLKLSIPTFAPPLYKGSAPTPLDYSSRMKGAITSFTRSLEALADKYIRVNGVAPGPVWTPLIPSTFPAKEVETFGSDVPLGRAGQPEEIAPELRVSCFRRFFVHDRPGPASKRRHHSKNWLRASYAQASRVHRTRSRTKRQAQRDLKKGRAERRKKPSRKRSRSTKRALKRESRHSASTQALSRHAKRVARQRSTRSRSAAAKKAARTRKRRR